MSSFSSFVKEELSGVIPEARNQRVAELAAVLLMDGRMRLEDGEPALEIVTEHPGTVRKYFTLLEKTYKIENSLSVSVRSSGGGAKTYTVLMTGETAVAAVLQGCRLSVEGAGEIRLKGKRLIYDSGSRQAFLRGAFLAGGSMTDPEKFYHLEFVCPDETCAGLLREVLASFDISAGKVERKKRVIVYVKDSERISGLLGLMEAPRAVLKMEEILVYKDVRNGINRQVNCEAANLLKSVSAATRQREDIEYIRDSVGLDTLPEPLAEMAEVRLQFPDAPLKDLGQHLSPPVGKSGVNHRLRKLSEYADELRGRRSI